MLSYTDTHLAAGEAQEARLNALILTGTSWAGVLMSLSWSPGALATHEIHVLHGYVQSW